MGRPRKPGHADDGDGGGARALDLAAHGVETLFQIFKLRLAGGVVDHRGPMGEDGGQHGVFGGAHRGDREGDLRPLQPAGGLGVDVALVQVDARAQGLHGHQVQIHRPRADGAAAGQADLGLAGAGQERTEDIERGAHLADEVVRGEG